MRNKIFVFFFVLLSAGMFSGCGGEYAGLSENAGVSGGAVSASAVSGQAVSGQPVSAQAVSGQEEKKHLYSNDTNVYYLEYDGDDDEITTLVERNLDTGKEKRMRIGNKDDIIAELLFVDNEWIYYYVLEEEDVFYRSPVKKSGDSLHVDLEEEERLFAETHGVDGMSKSDHGPFCNGKWIAYATAEGKFCRYDINKRTALSPVGEFAAMENQEGLDGVLVGLSYEEDDYHVEWMDGDSGKLVRMPLDEETNYGQMTQVDGIGVFLADSYMYDEKDDPVEKMDLCLWHFLDSAHPEGRVEKIVEGEKIQSLLRGRDDIGERALFETVSIFVREDTVYQQISAEWEKEDVTYRNMIILSYDLSRDGERLVSGKTLKVEKELSRILENPKENQKKFFKVWQRARAGSNAFFYSRGLCVEMTEQYAFFVVSEKEKWRTALYSFESGKLKFINEKDPEWGILHRDSPLFEADANFMPDNEGEDVPGPEDR